MTLTFRHDEARTAAIASGQTHYTGRPCTLGHTLRYATNGGCVTCAKHGVTRRTRARFVAAGVPPYPEDNLCQCCGTKTRLIADHDHALERQGATKAESFRGWTCYNCNISIGRLGDTLDAINRARDYLLRAAARRLTTPEPWE